MRYWLGKPLLIVVLIGLSLAVFSAWYVWSGPALVGAADSYSTPHQRRVEQLIRRIDRGE